VDTSARQLVTIVTEAIVEHRLIDDVKKCGAQGYSIGHVHGEGVTGSRSLELNGPSIRLETVVPDAVADTILAMLAEKYFDKYATVAWVTPTRVVRPGRF
jgi:nitrogen regulatory protein P-II 2